MDSLPRRPSEQALDRQTCLMLLDTKAVGRIVLPGEDPFIVPVNFVVIDEHIVFRSDPSSHAARSVGSAVAFEVDTVDIEHEAGWSIVVRGTLQDLTDRMGDDSRLHRLQPWAPGDKRRWLAVHLGEITGRWVTGPLHPPSHDDDHRGYL